MTHPFPPLPSQSALDRNATAIRWLTAARDVLLFIAAVAAVAAAVFVLATIAAMWVTA